MSIQKKVCLAVVSLLLSVFGFLSSGHTAGLNHVNKLAKDGEAVCGEIDNQLIPSIISDGMGGAIIVWEDNRNGSGYDIYAQRIDASGAKLWFPPSPPSIPKDKNGIAICTAIKDQMGPRLISDGNHGAIIVWEDKRNSSGYLDYDIYAQRINASGVVQWTTNGVPICTAIKGGWGSELTSDGNGGAIIVWEDFRGGSNNIYVQQINASGIVQWATDGVPICTGINGAWAPQLTQDGKGGAIIMWQDVRNGIDYDIYAQQINASGNVQWTTNGIPISTAIKHQVVEGLIQDGKGGAIVVWGDTRNGSGYDIYTQRINASGAKLWFPPSPPSMPKDENGIAICTAAWGQFHPELMILNGKDDVIIIWSDDRNYPHPVWVGLSYADIYAQRIDASGAKLWFPPSTPSMPKDENGIAICIAAYDQVTPRLISDGKDGAIIVWQDHRNGIDYDIYAQRIDASANVQWTTNGIPICTAIKDQMGAELTQDGKGGAIIVWGDTRNGITNHDIYAQWIVPDGIVNPATGVSIFTNKTTFSTGEQIKITAIGKTTNLFGLKSITIGQKGGFTWNMYADGKSYTVDESIYMDPGVYKFYAIAEDMDGNKSTTATVTIIVKEKPLDPTAIIWRFTYNYAVEYPIEPVQFEANSNVGLKNVTIVQSGPVADTMTYDGKGKGTLCMYHTPKFTKPGKYGLKVIAEDIDGRKSKITSKSAVIIDVY